MIFVAIGIAAYAAALSVGFALCRAAFLGDRCISESQRDAGGSPEPPVASAIPHTA